MFVISLKVEEMSLMVVKCTADEVLIIEDSYSFQTLEVSVDMLDIDLVALTVGFNFGWTGNLDGGIEVHILLFSELGASFPEASEGILGGLFDII